jgi:hypothetical protein
MLPFTPVSEALLEPEWLKTETPVYAASCGELTPSTLGLLGLGLGSQDRDRRLRRLVR